LQCERPRRRRRCCGCRQGRQDDEPFFWRHSSRQQHRQLVLLAESRRRTPTRERWETRRRQTRQEAGRCRCSKPFGHLAVCRLAFLRCSADLSICGLERFPCATVRSTVEFLYILRSTEAFCHTTSEELHRHQTRCAKCHHLSLGQCRCLPHPSTVKCEVEQRSIPRPRSTAFSAGCPGRSVRLHRGSLPPICLRVRWHASSGTARSSFQYPPVRPRGANPAWCVRLMGRCRRLDTSNQLARRCRRVGLVPMWVGECRCWLLSASVYYSYAPTNATSR
jgi:hypothetical protein